MKKLTIDETYAIANLLDNFDFNKAHALFTIMGWTYNKGNTPSVETLYSNAKNILTNAIIGKTSWECGRFRASYNDDDNELTLEVIFYSETVIV